MKEIGKNTKFNIPDEDKKAIAETIDKLPERKRKAAINFLKTEVEFSDDQRENGTISLLILMFGIKDLDVYFDKVEDLDQLSVWNRNWKKTSKEAVITSIAASNEIKKQLDEKIDQEWPEYEKNELAGLYTRYKNVNDQETLVFLEDMLERFLQRVVNLNNDRQKNNTPLYEISSDTKKMILSLDEK